MLGELFYIYFFALIQVHSCLWNKNHILQFYATRRGLKWDQAFSRKPW